MKNKILISAVYAAAAVLLAVGPYTLFKVCAVMEKPMKCWWSVRAEIGIALLLAVHALLYLFTKSNREKLFVTLGAAAVGVIAILIPSVLIGGCKMATMACQSVTFPSVYVIAGIVIAVSVVNGFTVIIKNN